MVLVFHSVQDFVSPAGETGYWPSIGSRSTVMPNRIYALLNNSSMNSEKLPTGKKKKIGEVTKIVLLILCN